jgi:hypothetical protein
MAASAEYGAWDADAVTRIPSSLIKFAPGRLRHGCHVSAVDHTKVQRSGGQAWGTGTSYGSEELLSVAEIT